MALGGLLGLMQNPKQAVKQAQINQASDSWNRPKAAPAPAPKPAPKPTGQYTAPPPPPVAQAPAPAAAPPAAPGPVTSLFDKEKADVEMDPDLLQLIAEYERGLGNTRSMFTNQKSGLDQQLSRSKDQVEEQKQNALEQLINEYSARGGLRGSPYLKANADTEMRYSGEWAEIEAAINAQKAAADKGILDAENMYNVQRDNALQQAIMRRQQAILAGLGG